MRLPPTLNVPERHLRFGVHVAAWSALAAVILAACDAKCPAGTVAQGKFCHRADALTANAGADATGGLGSSGTGGGMTQPAAGAAGGGGTTARAGASGAGGSKAPPIAPMVEWMCMKNAAGECTSCKQDANCPKRVCEQGFCMDCRNASECGADESCISNRCVPERKPSGIWTTSGGGLTSSAGFKLQLSVGTPSPATNASAAGFKVNVAPGAGLY